jgi:hypothetical protein
MKKIKFFFDTLTKSLTKFSFYKEIKKANFSFSLKYLFFLFYVLSLITSIIFAFSIGALILPKVPAFVNGFQSKASSLYPKGLIVNVKNGIVSTNQKEPFYIDSLNQFGLSKGYEHFITIDTSSTNPKDIQDDKTMILVTKDSVVTIDNKSASSYKVYPIDQTTNYKIDENAYNKIISQITPYLRYIQPILIALILLSILVWPLVGAAFSTIGQLIYLLLFSGIFFIVVKLMKKDLSFQKLYQLAIHASSLPILLGFIVSSIGIQMPFLLGTGILFVFMILVINQL